MRYVHQPLGEEIRSIGGFYKVLEEGTLSSDSREVLYILKVASFETACCGSGGMGYIFVPGYVVSLKSGKNPDGLDVSEVERVTDPEVRKKIRGTLTKKYPYIQVVDFE